MVRNVKLIVFLHVKSQWIVNRIAGTRVSVLNPRQSPAVICMHACGREDFGFTSNTASSERNSFRGGWRRGLAARKRRRRIRPLVMRWCLDVEDRKPADRRCQHSTRLGGSVGLRRACRPCVPSPSASRRIKTRLHQFRTARLRPTRPGFGRSWRHTADHIGGSKVYATRRCRCSAIAAEQSVLGDEVAVGI